MNILSQDGKTLINYNNIANLCMQSRYMQHSSPATWWEINAIYPAVSSDVLYDTIAKFDNEKECKEVFDRIVREICEQKLDFIKV